MKQINGTDLIKEYVRTSLEIRLKDWDGKEAIYFKGISAGLTSYTRGLWF